METARLQQKRNRRERNRNPLILTGHGNSMRIDNGALVIREGFSHYPQTQVTHRYFKGDLNLPSRILLLDGSGSLSFDVLSWLGQQGVALIRIDWTGEIAIAVAGTGYALDRAKVAWQHQARADNALRMKFSRDLISQKLANSISTLKAIFPENQLRQNAITKANAAIAKLANPIGEINELRQIEGECAKAYFAAWTTLQLNWKGESRHPIPDEWRTFRSRSSILTGHKMKNRKASHPINAMLNYAYTVKLAQLQIEVIGQGYDPAIGIMHHEREGVSAFIFDKIEPERPKVDATILQFISTRTFSAADFVIRPDGVCRLSPQLARTIAAMTSQ